jgi:Na+-transporting NADH:ubiquinone oxidoreductase subunit NqrC
MNPTIRIGIIISAIALVGMVVAVAVNYSLTPAHAKQFGLDQEVEALLVLIIDMTVNSP